MKALPNPRMTPERWRQIEELCHAAGAQPAEARAAFLAEACADDEALRREVESLLAEELGASTFLSVPAAAVMAPLLVEDPRGALIGQRIGPYEVRSLLGVGGMGEVYRAHHAALGRDVAIKVLAPAFTTDPERRARLDREARLLATLNHPHIAAIYGVEQGPFSESADTDPHVALVLELVEGDTLAERIAGPRSDARGAPSSGLSLAASLDVARQLTDALEAAHDKGVVHRDLKPANIKITPAGVVKVLDFGLAKASAADDSDLDPTQSRAGSFLGTPAYMSPEQARGHQVDKRTDIWAFGCVLYEMLSGRLAFPGGTVSDTIASILEHEPDWTCLPAGTPPTVHRLLRRCLAKDSRKRIRDIGDVRLEIDAIDDALPIETGTPAPLARAQRRTTWLPWVALAALAVAVGVREVRRPAMPEENPLANATFSRVTNWQGTEEQAEISPDGRFVAFLADKDGQFDVWVSQVGTGSFDNLTQNLDPMTTPGNLLRSLGFSGDGSEIWFNPSGNAGGEKVLMPLTGGVPRPFLDDGHSTPSWSPDNAHLAYIASSTPGDPLFIADRTGADARPVVVPDQTEGAFFRRGVHTHNPVWSPDGRWIYFMYGAGSSGTMDVWRMQPSGESPEPLTHQAAPLNFLTPLDSRTLLYVARAEDWSGPWLWALDVESQVTRRVTAGLEQYTSVSASRDGRRVVATVANPTSTLWRVPLLDRLVEDDDAQPFVVPTERALAPRFGGTSLFYLSLSARGNGDGLWRVLDGQAFEVRKGADGVLSEPPAPSPDGSRVVVVVRRQGKRHLAIMSADGTNSRTLAATIDIRGEVTRGTADWSPDGAWIVTGGDDGLGPGLFKIAVDSGEPVRIVTGEAHSPVWSPTDDLIVYATPFAGAGGSDALRGVRPDGTPVELPQVQVRRGGAHRFLRSGGGLVYLPSIDAKDFWLVDLTTNRLRPLTHLSDRGYLNTFDVTPDGKHLVFDRSRQNSDVVLIDLPKK